ncbi:MAG TPA: HNH endonuclease [Thermoanaerobaculia bacterium]|nr:HNH endonuclease [Thermoanaerobaculia bacterium]
MKSYIGITDGSWFDLLSHRQDLDEINFWQPGGSRRFRALSLGEPFLFKLHSPLNYIVGGGFFGYAPEPIPAYLAWETFGEANGARTFSEMLARIEKYRRGPTDPRGTDPIGCILLQQPFYFSRDEWIPAPRDWHKNLVQGKTYDTATGEGARVWAQVSEQLAHRSAALLAEAPDSPLLVPTETMRRIGQGTFRVLITDTYQRRCAATGEKALPVLEASHIRPVADGGRHEIANGLLLRSDIHRLFDRGYVTVDPKHRIRVSRRLKDEFDNGEPYYPLEGHQIWLPRRTDARPSPESLEYHRDVVFRG